MAPSGVFQICRAVAIDCEMGTAESGDSELIRITLIDYFTSAILLDNLVLPDVPMRDLRTRFSGVTWNQMRAAKKEGSCIKGRDNARRAVWKYVGPDTVVIGHSSNNDLTALRWIHKNVVDTFILESGLKREKEELRAQYETQCAETQPTQTAADAQASREGAHMARAVQALEHLSLSSSGPLPSPLESATGQNKSQQGKKKMNGPGPLSLKVLALTRLGREIQTGDRKGHDSLEDAVATRDLAEWHVREKERTLHNNNMGDGAV